jgi:hypothetical protein
MAVNLQNHTSYKTESKSVRIHIFEIPQTKQSIVNTVDSARNWELPGSHRENRLVLLIDANFYSTSSNFF